MWPLTVALWSNMGSVSWDSPGTLQIRQKLSMNCFLNLFHIWLCVTLSHYACTLISFNPNQIESSIFCLWNRHQPPLPPSTTSAWQKALMPEFKSTWNVCRLSYATATPDKEAHPVFNTYKLLTIMWLVKGLLAGKKMVSMPTIWL